VSASPSPLERAPSEASKKSGAGRARAKKGLLLVSGLALSALFLWLALRGIDPNELASSLARAAWWPLVPCALALFLFYWLKVERWRLLIRAEHGASRSRLVDPMMMGFAANNVLPLRIGELIRVYTAGRTLGVPKTQVFASLVVERVLDLLSVAVLVSGALVFVHLREASDGQDMRLLIAAVLAMLVAGAGLLLPYVIVGKDLSPFARWVPGRFRASVESLLRQFAAGLEPITDKRLLLPTLLSSLAQWLLVALCIQLSMMAVGVELHLMPVSMIVLGLVVLGISIPSGPAYVGTIEYAFVLGLGFFGVEPAVSLAAGIYYHVFLFVSVTTAGAICWGRYALLGRHARAAEAKAPS